ncbi:MAG: hypothetical protein ACI4SR_01960 [Faecalibacillus sp.]
MKCIFMFADIVFCICSNKKIEIDNEMNRFMLSDSYDNHFDVEILLNDKYNDFSRCYQIGDDLIQAYYLENRKMICELKGGDKGAIGYSLYDKNYDYFQCFLNQYHFDTNLFVLRKILRTLPMRAIFLHYQALFFHASQISINGVGILFTAPSGTGKSTQARLWERFESAHIVCNDRTIVRKINDQWMTYGYPLDGSQPVANNEKNRLGAIVILKQGKINVVERYNIAKMLSLLIEQIVLDTWNSEMKEKAMSLLVEVVKDIPVYVLTCTPDINAVMTLKKQLQKERVIE